MMTLGIHAHWMGQAPRASALRSFIDYAQQTGEAWFATRGEIASWWHAHHAEFGTNAGGHARPESIAARVRTH
jgi:hypothetical protein